MAERRETGALEHEVLVQLWQLGGASTPAEVLARMGDDLAYTTVMTILTRLWKKGLVTRERRGRAFAYEAAISEADLAATRMRATLDRVDDRAEVLSRFVGQLTRRDERALRRALDSLDQK